MDGLMMQQQLQVSALLRHAERHHATQQIVSRRVEGDIHRYTFRDLGVRSRQLAQALGALGVEQATRVGTLAWNGYRHLELYYGTSGSGAVLHTINPRLHPDQLAWIITDAGDEVLFFDINLAPLVAELKPRLPCVRHFVAMTDREHLPTVDDSLCYEDILAAQNGDYEWPELEENTAASLCYTSGTTGNPKGVLYSHRSTVLHSYAIALPDSLNLSARDCVMPVVPMFHVNAWGMPYSACMVGSKIVFPGADLDGASLYQLLESEQVTMTASVPTVWQGLLQYVGDTGRRFTSLARGIVGGAACPPSMLRELEQIHDIQVIHGWGMTETSPFGTAAVLKRHQLELPASDRFAIQGKQGRCVFGIDLKIVGDDGAELPWDGASPGHLLVRGPWVLSHYYGSEATDPLCDGWFPTGDIATIDSDGFMQITDRSKDVIKSGGEWISSIDLENLASTFPGVEHAACVGVAHPRWQERPLLVVTARPGMTISTDDLREYLADHVAKWWVPDAVVVVDAMPIGATGKILKSELRERYQNHLVASRH